MSGLGELGTYNFNKSSSQSKAFRDEPKGSRASRRSEKDELDKLVDNKWQMSTVKEDITKEIEQLLQKKDNNNINSLQPSQVDTRQVSRGSRGGLPYDGPALNTLSNFDPIQIQTKRVQYQTEELSILIEFMVETMLDFVS